MTLTAWGGSPSHFGTCATCGARIAWGIDVHQQRIPLDSEPHLLGTMIFRQNGNHVLDLEDRSVLSVAAAELLAKRKLPQYRRHGRSCDMPRGGPRPITGFRTTLARDGQIRS